MTVWPDHRLCDLLEIEHPIVQAPMAGSSTSNLAAAVSNAGGLGSMGCGTMGPDALRATIAELRGATNRPVNLNFFAVPAPRTAPDVLENTRALLRPWYDRLGLGPPPDSLPDLPASFGVGQMDILLAARPAIVSFHFGVPAPECSAALKEAGIMLLSSATTSAEARTLQDAGMDAVIARGWEAGGHRGSQCPTAPMDGVGTLALVPQVADAVSVPMIAAGGIGDGRGIAAAFALGASGVQIGTRFLSCPEAATDAPRRALLANAKDTDTIVTDGISCGSCRDMRSRLAEEMEADRTPRPGFRQMYALTGPILDAAPDEEASFHLYGQAAALNRALPAADLLQHLVAEANEAISQLSPT